MNYKTLNHDSTRFNEAHGICKQCNCKTEVGHISELDREVQFMVHQMFKLKDAYIVFCPNCEAMRFVKDQKVMRL
jgi:hypothetical protein